MTASPTTVEFDKLMRDVLDIMKSLRIANVVVIDGERTVAVLHIKDLMQKGFF